MDNQKLKEIEERLAKLEEKAKEYDKYIKTDIKQGLSEKEEFQRLEKKIDFVDSKVERQKDF